MQDSSTRAVLEHHKRDLEDKIAAKATAFENDVAPLRRDLADVRRAIGALGAYQPANPNNTLATNAAAIKMQTAAEVANCTMKELTIRALLERFPNGANSRELLHLFWNEWDRKDVVRSSYSPQLSRLKDEGIVALSGGKWHLVSALPISSGALTQNTYSCVDLVGPLGATYRTYRDADMTLPYIMTEVEVKPRSR
jgi:hypothetical protein